MDEINIITDYIQNEAGSNAEVIWGHGLDNSLGENINITLIATGFSMSETPVHGLEKPAETKMIDLEEETRVEISSPMTNPVSVTSTNNVENDLTETTTTQFASEDLFISNDTQKVSPINNTTEPIVYEIEDNVDVTNNLIVSDLEENEEKESSISTNEVVFDWEVEDISNELPSSNAETLNVNQNESKPVVQYELEDENEYSAPARRTVLSPEEQQMKNLERVNRIKEHTMKLKLADGITEFENEPAYVRRNIHLSDESSPAEKTVSKFGLSDDNNGSVRLRGNSFLHDNVD